MTSLGYLVPEWPTQTHAFFWRELCALRDLGNTVSIFSTKRPSRDSCRHAFAAEAHASTRYVFPPRSLEVARVLASRPRKVAAAIEYVIGLNQAAPREQAFLIATLACAADLVAHCEELDIEHVHVHSCATAAHLVAMARLLGGPGYSLTLHGDLDVYGRDHVAKMRGARFVSAVTRPLQEQVMGLGVLDADRVPVIWMGVDTDRFAPASRARRAGELRLLTVARLNPAKGHLYALEAVRRSLDVGLDVHYTIAGEGTHRAAIEQTIQDLRLGSHVEMLGTVSEDQVLDLLRSSDVFVLSSEGLGEAAPVSVMEAMSVGLPVVCSEIGGTKDMVTNGVEGFLVAQRDVAGLADAFERLARDPAMRDRFGSAARSRALAAFDFRIMAGKLNDVMAQAVGADSP